MRKLILAALIAVTMVAASGCSLTTQYAVTVDGTKVENPYHICVDGEPVAIVATEEDGKTIISSMKKYYGEGGKIMEDVTVEPADVKNGHPVICHNKDTLDIIMKGQDEKITYTASAGDTLESVANDLGVLKEDLAEWNPDVGKIKEGKELTAYVRTPLVHVKTKGKVTYTEEMDYDTTYIETDDLFKGEKKTKSEGVKGKRKVRAEATYINGILVLKDPISEKVTRETVSKVVYKGTRETGKDVVEYAKEFLGNPYILGGRDLENGIDCSGFTSAVYAHFGYTIPPHSESQLQCGIEVEYSDARPGDLIIYEDHVALYEGKGKIIHARNEYVGIIEGEADYRPIKGIRRIIY